MTAEEFEAMKEGTDERRNLQVRQVSNGFQITATRTFYHAGTESAKFGVNIEGVAMDANLLLNATENFIRHGQLSAVQA